MIKLLIKICFWFLLLVFGFSLAYGLISFYFLKTVSGLEMAIMIGGWLVIWFIFGFGARWVFANRLNIKTSDIVGLFKKTKLAEYIGLRSGGKEQV